MSSLESRPRKEVTLSSSAHRSWNQAIPSERELHHAKRRAVLREAARSFNRHGYHATTLEAVARKLGITKAALYHYFPNKNALLKACFDEVMEAAFENLERARTAGRNGREKLRMVFVGYLQHIIDELTVAVVVLEATALTDAERAEAFGKRDRFECALRDLVAEGIEDGSIVPCNPKLVVMAMLGAVNWVPRWFRQDGEWSTQQLAEAMSDLLDRAISSRPGKALATQVHELDPKPIRGSTGAEQPKFTRKKS